METVIITTPNPHLLDTGEDVVIAGADVSQFNGTFTITVIDPTSFSYSAPDFDFCADSSLCSPTPATGNITVEPITKASLLLVWDGINLTLSDEDQVPFDEEMAHAVSLYIKAGLDHHLGMSASEQKNDGAYRQAKAKLYTEKKGHRKIG
jgi:hypothetical protein|tara:strand:- start:5185 stop:5634 length:450 start_codon:yes stop_codon:yes gene_type:complete